MPADNKKTPWFHSPLAVLAAALLGGPLAIPLVWMSGAFKRWQKWAITIALIIITVWLIDASANIYRLLLKELQDLKALLNQ